MSHPKGKIVDSEQGLFIFTPDGIYRFGYDSDGNPCFKAIDICNQQGEVVANIITINDDPK